MTSVTVITTAVLALGVLVGPRRWALAPFLVAACLVPMDQRVLIADLHFPTLRFLVLAGALRVAMRGEWKNYRENTLGWTIFAWAAVNSVVYSIQHGTLEAVINRSGFMFDVVGLYVLARMFLRDFGDLRALFTAVAACLLALAPAVAFELFALRNPFVMIGAVPEYVWVREGTARCRAVFGHSIIMGCFATALLCMVLGWALYLRRSWLAWAGVAAGGFIVFASGSSTPYSAALASLVVFAGFRWRHWLPAVRWGAVACVVGLHFAMNAPVWHLISRVPLVPGATGWHRYLLIDRAIAHVGEWFLLGTTSTEHWGWGLRDITNQFVLEGVRGGMAGLVLFVAVLVLGFRAVGQAMRGMGTHPFAIVPWGVGVALFSHCVSFIGVSYFWQGIIALYLTFALCAYFGDVAVIRAAQTRRAGHGETPPRLPVPAFQGDARGRTAGGAVWP